MSTSPFVCLNSSEKSELFMIVRSLEGTDFQWSYKPFLQCTRYIEGVRTITNKDEKARRIISYNTSADTLELLHNWCKRHAEDMPLTIDHKSDKVRIPAWDKKFLRDLTSQQLGLLKLAGEEAGTIRLNEYIEYYIKKMLLTRDAVAKWRRNAMETVYCFKKSLTSVHEPSTSH